MEIVIDDFNIIIRASEGETEEDVQKLQEDLNADMVMCLPEEQIKLFMKERC